MAKHLCNICDETEDSDSEEQYTSDESENESSNDLSETLTTVLQKMKNDMRKKKRQGYIIHHFTAPDNGLIRTVEPL
jgi:uncharacterized Zn finger protein (UPF0148 family)